MKIFKLLHSRLHTFFTFLDQRFFFMFFFSFSLLSLPTSSIGATGEFLQVEEFNKEYNIPDLQLKLKIRLPLSFVPALYIHTQWSITNYGEPREICLRIYPRGDSNYRYGAAMVSTDSDVQQELRLAQGETLIDFPILSPTSYQPYAFSITPIHPDEGKPFERNINIFLPVRDKRLIFIGQLERPIIDRLEEAPAPSAISTRAKPGTTKPFRLLKLEPREAPGDWQSYIGYAYALILHGDAVAFLSPRQKLAIKYWVYYGGGILWLHGNRAFQAFNELELSTTHSCKNDHHQDAGIFYALSGTIIITENSQHFDQLATRNKIHSFSRMMTFYLPFYYFLNPSQSPYAYGGDLRGRYSREESPFLDLFSGLHVIPRTGYVIVALLLTLVIGPLNYRYLKKRKKLIYFYITAPLLAITGVIALAIYSIINQGFGVTFNHKALLVHDLDLGTGVVYHARGIFAGMAPSESLVFSRETAVLPFYTSSYRSEYFYYSFNYTSAQSLSRDFVRSRQATGLFTATPTRIRLGLEIKYQADGSIFLENHLTSTVLQTIVRLPPDSTHQSQSSRWQFYQTRSAVAPGSRAILIPLKSRLDSQFSAFNPPRQPFIDLENYPWTILAETDSLPYLEDGGCPGTTKKGNYIYLGIHHVDSGPDSNHLPGTSSPTDSSSTDSSGIDSSGVDSQSGNLK